VQILIQIKLNLLNKKSEYGFVLEFIINISKENKNGLDLISY